MFGAAFARWPAFVPPSAAAKLAHIRKLDFSVAGKKGKGLRSGGAVALSKALSLGKCGLACPPPGLPEQPCRPARTSLPDCDARLQGGPAGDFGLVGECESILIDGVAQGNMGGDGTLGLESSPFSGTLSGRGGG